MPNSCSAIDLRFSNDSDKIKTSASDEMSGSQGIDIETIGIHTLTANTKKHTMQEISERYAVYLLVGNSPPINIRITGDPLPTSKLERSTD
ncbi:MAG: hypothetical protein F6K54_02985 [Okeania sp. SIO3B5]|uniref:hypothetical protein n=1 Tax=Okeania sp. SIO3B5 TaxID=2607811 RepID=UPI0014000447|nr:hypothetical protein [Okeania sp. SIO3B5]NEO52138.1 hypothetical protein [Okeania sp. SIO3B5]